jgi:DNA polymerase-3 subunit epsilon
MKCLIFDTETTGLPDWNAPSDDPCQPRVTQLCAELFDDETGEVFAAMNFIIKPDGWEIPPDLEKLTGITNEKANAVGVDMAIVLPAFFDLWEKCEQRIAHNESFDMRMIRIELFRDARYGQEYADKWKAGKVFDTCKASQGIVNLPPTEKMRATGRFGPKPPNLGEAYRHFTGLELENAHNAAVDVLACKEIYLSLKLGKAAA